MHDLEYNTADESMALPSWVTRPTLVVQALVASSFILVWLIAEQASRMLLMVDGVNGWYMPAGLGVALVWALGLRYAWVVAVSAWLGGLVVAGLPLLPAVLSGFVLGLCYTGTAYLARRALPAGRLPVRPIEVGGVIASMLAGALATAILQTGLMRLLGWQYPGGANAIDTVVAWTVSDALGMLVTAPLIVMVLAPWMCSLVCKGRDENKARYVRAIGCAELQRDIGAWLLIGAVSIGLAVLICLPERCDPRVYYLGFVALPALAMRYRLGGGLIALALTCAGGVFAVRLSGVDLPTLTDLQLVMIALAISTILVSSFAVMRASAEERRQSEHHWATLAIRGSGMGRWYWEIDSNQIATDYILTDAFGYRRDKVSPYLSWWEQRIHPEDVRLNQQQMELLLSGKNDYFEVENRMLAADGTWGWFHSQGTVIERNSQGQPKRVAGTHNDITERKELERISADAEATHRSEKRFRTLADGAPVAIFQTDAKGVFLYVNPAWRGMIGQEQTDALYRSASAFAHRDDRNEVADHWATAVKTATPVAIEHRVVTPDKRTLWIKTQATPMRHNGVLLGFVGTGVDVTPYREAMTMIRDSEARYRTLADHAYDMLWRVNANADFTYVSPSITKLMGYAPEEMVATNAFDYFHPEDIDLVREKHAALGPDTPEFQDVHRFRRKDGTYIVFEAVGRLVVPEDPDEQPYITGISRDVTQRVESQRIQKELEEKLTRSQKLDAIGTFATGIAHDFRNSLLAIKASAQSAQRKLDADHAALPALATVQDACAQAMQVTQSLLTFARGPGTSKRKTDLSELVRNNARLLSAVLPASIRLNVDCPEQPINIQANVSELQQALLNLVMNAKDAIKGQGEIHIRLTSDDTHATLTVADTGVGMTPDVLNRALEPFYTTKARLKGTGLGLAQVHGIVTDHGGDITLASVPDQGTTITLTLRLTPPPSATPRAIHSTQAATP